MKKPETSVVCAMLIGALNHISHPRKEFLS